MSYRAIKISENVAEIRAMNRKCGHMVRRADGQWYATIIIKPHSVEHIGSYSEAFQMVVTYMNRIHLCGVNDAHKAREALERRNARCVREAQEFNDLVGLPVYPGHQQEDCDIARPIAAVRKRG